jgi:predicted GIY-YIG superfamily endonuclease
LHYTVSAAECNSHEQKFPENFPRRGSTLKELIRIIFEELMRSDPGVFLIYLGVISKVLKSRGDLLAIRTSPLNMSIKNPIISKKETLMKQCSNPNCSETQPSFSKNRAASDGLQAMCIVCHRHLYEQSVDYEPRKNRRHKSYSQWTINDERLFKKVYVQKSTKELCQLFDKSESAIKSKARELKLRKPETYKILDSLDSKERLCGVYLIKNKVSGKFYIGSSIDIYQRLRKHIQELEDKKHKNKSLQSDWAKSNFIFIICKLFDTAEEAQEYEHQIITTYQYSDLIYNKDSHLSITNSQQKSNKPPIQQIRQDWLSGVYTVKQLNQKYGLQVHAIIRNRSYYDPTYNPPKRKRGRK